MNFLFFDRFSRRVQFAVVISLVLHVVVVSHFGPRRFSRPNLDLNLTDVEYVQFAPPISTPSKPRPKPVEVVDLEKSDQPAEAVPEEEEAEPETQADQSGFAYNPNESQTGIFLPFYSVEQQAVFESSILPVYPENARKLEQTSKVILEAYIDATGVVRMIRVAKSGGQIFDQAAVEALKKSRFRPARINGRPVPVKILVPYVFELER